MSMRSVLFLLFIAVSCSGLNIELKVQNDPQCKFLGQQCSSDLKSIIYCTAENGNSYVVTTCSGNRKCKKNPDGEYACLTGVPDFPETTPRNDTVFTCEGEGSYPDGYRCNVGYLCSKPGTYPELVCECPPKSAITFYPKFSCTTDEGIVESCGCPYRDRCKESVSAGDFGENCHTGYYYICKGDGRLGFVPEVHKCPDSQIFINGSCIQGTDQISTATITANVQPVCRNYYPVCTQESNVKCSQRGELLPHNIERCYYFCSADLKPLVRDCGKGSIFTCKYGNCGCVLAPKH